MKQLMIQAPKRTVQHHVETWAFRSHYGGTYEFGYYSVSVVDGIFDFSQEEEIIIKWVVANLTCQDAQSNAKYACVSHNSNCQNVTRGKTHYGYRCKCNDGFHGNPYLQNENTCTGYISLLNHICTASHFSNTTFIKKATIHTCYIFRVFRILMHLLPPPAPPRSHIALPFWDSEDQCMFLLASLACDATMRLGGLDIDECSIPNKCNWICHNYDGGFNCTGCSHGKMYDPTKQKCVMSAKKHNLILGKSSFIHHWKMNSQIVNFHI
jgi:hypothetical protein